MSWFRWFRSAQQVATRPAPKKQPRRLSIEMLEDRTVPTTFVLTDTSEFALRQAIMDANNESSHPGADVIQYADDVSGTVELTSRLPQFQTDITIRGPQSANLTIRPKDGFSFETIVVPSGGVTRLSNLTLAGRGNDLSEPVVINNGKLDLSTVVVRDGRAGILNAGELNYQLGTISGHSGYGLSNSGMATLDGVLVRDNTGTSTSSDDLFVGGGIISFAGSLTIRNSTIANNKTVDTLVAAGIDVEGGSALIVNSTISGNQAIRSNSAGGIGVYGGTVEIAHSTVTDNTGSANFLDSGSGGGVDAFGLGVTIYNTIIAGNRGPGGTDIKGEVTSLGHNLIGIGERIEGFNTALQDQVGNNVAPISANLGALQDNGGPTPTHLPQAGSRAINRGDNANAPATDQRGLSRIAESIIDIGAVEANATAGLRFAITANQPNPTVGVPFEIIVSVRTENNDRADDYTGTIRFTSTDPDAVLPNDSTFQIADQGTRRFTVTLKAAGPQFVFITDVAAPSVGGSLFVTLSQDVPPAPPIQPRRDLNQFEAKVNQLFIDLLGREADDNGLAFFANELVRGTPLTEISRAIQNSFEYRSRVVGDLYVKHLGRVPEAEGLNAQIAALAAGASIKDIEAGILSSAEYFGRNGGSADTFLQALYRDALGRPIDPEGMAVWMNNLNGGLSRLEVALRILLSQENLQKDVQRLYQKYLKRFGEEAGVQNWVTQFQVGARDQDIITAFVTSSEYASLTGFLGTTNDSSTGRIGTTSDSSTGRIG